MIFENIRFLNESNNLEILEKAESDFNIKIKENIKNFIKKHSGSYPNNAIIDINGEEYEIRVFLSLDKSSDYYIERQLYQFLRDSNGKMIPIAIDSGDNYYCINNETEKVYYWSHELREFEFIGSGINTFSKAFK